MLTSLVALSLAVVPGALLGFLVPAGRYRWVAFAAAPATTLGLVATAQVWLAAVGLPHGALAVLVAEVGLAVLAVVVSRVVRARLDAVSGRRRRLIEPDLATGGAESRSDIGDEPTGRWRRLHRALGAPDVRDLAGVAVALGVTVSFGVRFFRGLDGVPGWDAMNHAFLTQRIIESGSTAVEDVCVTGTFDPLLACRFYPLAANIQWAQTAILTGGGVSPAMRAWIVVVAPVAMVAGVYCAVRLLGSTRIVASVAATMPALLGPTWAATRSGRITEQAAPAMAAGAALLLALALRGKHPVRLGALAGLSIVGILMTHTYDVLFVATLAVGIFAFWPPRDRRVGRHWRGMASSLGMLAVIVLVAVGPSVEGILGAKGERAQVLPTSRDFVHGMYFWLGDFHRYLLFGFPLPSSPVHTQDIPPIGLAMWVTIVVLAASALVLVIPSLRWARPWFAAAVFWTVVGGWTSSSDSRLAQLLSGLWYGAPERLRTMFAPTFGVIAVAGACVLLLLGWWLVRRALPIRGGSGPEARRTSSGHVTSVAAATLLIVLGGLGLAPSSSASLRQDLVNRSPVGAQYEATARWIKEHIRPGAVLATDRHVEFMSWAHGDWGVPILFGIPPLVEENIPQYEARQRAFRWLVNTKDSKPSGCDVRRFDIQFVALGNRRMPAWGRTYDPNRVDDTDRIRLVHEDRGLRVYEVTEAGRACPA